MYTVKATLENYADYYALRVDENNILWSGHNCAPNYEDLKEWYKKNIERSDRLFFLFYEDKTHNHILGYLYMDTVGEKKDTIDIGYGVGINYLGKGYGTKIIAFAIQHAYNNMPHMKFMQGWIEENNIGSIKTFLKNGYFKTSETREGFFQKIDKVVIFEKYIYKIKLKNGEPTAT